MIKPIEFPEQTRIYGGEGSRPLPVAESGDNYVSCWKIDPEDLEAINRTGKIWLLVKGSQPPVALDAEYPFVTE